MIPALGILYDWSRGGSGIVEGVLVLRDRDSVLSIAGDYDLVLSIAGRDRDSVLSIVGDCDSMLSIAGGD